MKKVVYVFLVLSICISGCSRKNEELTKEILKKDPGFRTMLDAKKHIDVRVDKLKSEYEIKRAKTSKKIIDLKKTLSLQKNELSAKISSIKQEINPKIEILKKRLAEITEKYKLAKKESREAHSKAANVRKLLNKKGELGLSGDEVAIWNKKISVLEKEINTTYKDLDKLRSRIRVLSAEIKILEK